MAVQSAVMNSDHEKPESLDRFLDPDLETLEEILDQAWDDEAMSLEELDGFFTALHCCPELVPQSEYLPEIVGPGEALDNEDLFPNVEAAKLFWRLVLHHWSLVGEALESEEPFAPLLQEDAEGFTFGNEWAVGFLRGVGMREDEWKEVLESEDNFAKLIPILALANENDPDPEARFYKEPISEELREQLLADLAEGVSFIYRYFAPQRRSRPVATPPETKIEKSKRKIGRNDPCNCGSGKKYKKCCGSVAAN
jgi:uncharacterized protein